MCSDNFYKFAVLYSIHLTDNITMIDHVSLINTREILRTCLWIGKYYLSVKIEIITTFSRNIYLSINTIQAF